MPEKTLDIARDTGLLMAAATFMLLGLVGLLAFAFGVAYPLRHLLVPDAALAALLGGGGLVALLLGRPGASRLLGGLLLAQVAYSLGHGQLAPGAGSWLTGEPRIVPAAAWLLVGVAACLLLGVGAPWRRRAWAVMGGLLLAVGGSGLIWLLFLGGDSRWPLVFVSAPMVAILCALLCGAALLLAGLRGEQPRPYLGRLAWAAALGGVVLSCTAWYLLAWQVQANKQDRADQLLDNVRLNAEQAMDETMLLMGRMAERLDAADGDLDEAVMRRDVTNYLRDAPSIQAIGLLDRAGRWSWGRMRDDAQWAWLGEQLATPRVDDWLSLSFRQARMMIPDPGRQAMALLVVSVDASGGRLVTSLDMAELLAKELRLQLGGDLVRIQRDGEVLLDLRAPGRGATEEGRFERLIRRHIGLPGGPMLTLEAYPDSPREVLLAGLVPGGVAISGLVFTYLMAFSLGLAQLAVRRSRALDRARRYLEAQQEAQGLIAREAPLDETLNRICRMLEAQLPGARSSIMRRQPDDTLVLLAGESLPEGYRRAIGSLQIGPDEGACGSSAALGEPVVCEDILTDPRWADYRSLAAEHGLRACWSSPVVTSHGRVLGTFASYFPEPGGPGEDELESLRQAADLVALALERHADRRALWESEQRYRSLFAYNPDAVFSLDLDGHFVSANATCSEITGLPVERILGAHFDRFVRPEDLPRILGHFRSTSAGEAMHYEMLLHPPEGASRLLEITNLPIRVDGQIRGVYGIAKDVTERREAETRLRILQRSVEASVNGVVIADAGRDDYPIIYANAAFQAMTGYGEAEILGRNCRFLQGPGTEAEAVEQIRHHLQERHEIHVSLCNYRKDGSPFWNDLYISPVRDAEGRVSHFVGVLHDISERRAYEARLAHHANHDALTGLANRSLFEDRLVHDAALARRHGQRIAVLFVDMDDFKPINDSLGHALGDRVLVEVARRLEEAMRASDTVARLGGDEFVVLLPDLTHEEQATNMAQRILQRVACPYRLDGQELHLTASIGIAVAGEEALDMPLELMQQADMAMYRAKRQGRNAYQWFTREITAKVNERLALRNDLQAAMEHDQLELHYQPLFDRDGGVDSLEALLRWKHPQKGYVSPAVFIPLAEETGQIMPISEWVLQRACLDMRRLEAVGLGRLRVAVNLSPLQFHRTGFLATLRQQLASTGLPAEQLCLELTEGILMDDTEGAIDILHALRGMGIRVAVDDFGTGFSSLSYLHQLPIATVKIDRSFVVELEQGEGDSAIVQGIVSMAHHLGLAVVAEGVETEAQRDRLLGYGCDVLQGFLLARPMPRDRLEAFLAQRC